MTAGAVPPGRGRIGWSGAARALAATAMAGSLPFTPHLWGVHGSGVRERPALHERSRPALAGQVTSPWTVYHGDALGSGIARTPARFSDVRRAWTSRSLGGQLYGEPLVATGEVIVATETDRVVALGARTGRVIWSRRIARPVPSNDLPCGDIAPTVGVTGTPVVDLSRREVFVVADELVDDRPSHHLVGLSIRSGKVLLDESVDPPAADPATLLQRTGLTLDRGDVVFGFGGNYGDCGNYHGWVVSAPEGGGTAGIKRYESDDAPGERLGAVWMGGAAPEVSHGGDVWVAIGNGSVKDRGSYDGSDAVVDLAPDLVRKQYFAPASWYADNGSDLDLGSTSPALLGGGLVVQAGKSGTAYLLERTRLGGVGGQLAETAVCHGGTADGGAAVTHDLVLLPCQSGLEAVRVSGRSLAVLWTATGPAGPPVVAGGTAWSIGDDALFGLRPGSGTVVARVQIGSNANHFPTPSFGDGRLFVTGGADGDEVLAFSPRRTAKG